MSNFFIAGLHCNIGDRFGGKIHLFVWRVSQVSDLPNPYFTLSNTVATLGSFLAQVS